MSNDLNKYMIDDRIVTVKFSCDLQLCKGACCTIKGTVGAPLLKVEIKKIESILDTVKEYLADVNLNWIDEYGFYERDGNEYALKGINNDDCIFSYYDNGIAKCAFQKAYYEKRTDFIKPISCHLFPIRINGEKRNILKYEKIYECNEALNKGLLEGISVMKFAKDGIIREFGKQFYYNLEKRLNN